MNPWTVYKDLELAVFVFTCIYVFICVCILRAKQNQVRFLVMCRHTRPIKHPLVAGCSIGHRPR